MTVQEPLTGCTPEPLMSYLKALGVLRLVSEDRDYGDPNARGSWRDDGVFVLKSTLDQEAIRKFFLEKYRPTPIVAPWNGGSGFYLKWDDKTSGFRKREAAAGIDGIQRSTAKRLERYREAVGEIRCNLRRIARQLDLRRELAGKTKDQKKAFLDSVLVFEVGGTTMCLTKAGKDDFLATLRSCVLDDDSLWWLDAALALTVGRKKNRHEAPLLGSGGNVGNSDFSAMFAQMMPAIMSLQDDVLAAPDSEQLLTSSLWGYPVEVPSYPIGQFDPGKAGGANQTQGFKASPQMNPWDYVLMCEGALVLSGAISRRAETSATGASFPFTVRTSNVGYGSAGREGTRGETWLPLWTRSASIEEVRVLFSEGRAEVGRRVARNGVEFARAVAMLGVDRGISSFIRYGYQERLGQSYLATSFGSFEVCRRPDVDLLHEIDGWLDQFRGAASGDKAPPRFMRALRGIESSIFEFCQHGGASRFSEILCALGRAERELATGERFREVKRLSPLVGLSPEWIRAATDGSTEFELALSLAGVWDPERKVGALRANLEPAKVGVNKKGAPFASWLDKDRAVVWTSADLSANLAAVLDRRIMDAGRKGCAALPLAFHCSASLGAISAFLAGQVDDARIEDLLWGLVLVDHSKKYPPLERPSIDNAPPLPRAYALIKLLFLPHPLDTGEGEVLVKPEPSVLALLRAGWLGESCAVSSRRLRASGLVPMPHRSGSRMIRDDEWLNAAAGVDPRRLAAALLLPIGRDDVNRLAALVLHRDQEPAIAVR